MKAKKKATPIDESVHSGIVPVKGGLVRLIKEYFTDSPWLLSLAIVCIVLYSLSAGVSAIVIKPIVDGANQVLNGTLARETYLSSTVWPYLGFMIGAYAVGIVAMVVYTIILGWLGQKFMSDLRYRIFSQMETLPLSFFDRNQKGDIMSVYTNDIEGIRQFIIQGLQVFITCSLTLLVLFAMMLIYSVYLMGIVLLTVIAMFGIATAIGKKASVHYAKQESVLGVQEGLIEEMMGGLKVVKSFNHEDQARAKFDKVNQALSIHSTKANVLSNALFPITNHVGTIAYVLIVLIGALMVSLKVTNVALSPEGFLNIMTLGTVIAFIPLAQQTIGCINQIGSVFPYVAMSDASAGRIYAIKDTKSEIDQGYVTLVQGQWQPDGSFKENPHPSITDKWAWKHPHQADGSITYAPLKGDIVMTDVDFSYEPGKTVLKGVSVYAKPGQKVALVGATGAGKTTITNLLNRFYDIADGKIRYDGININKIKKKDLRHSLGMVLQDTSLFTGTVMDNIRFGRLDATDEECIAAAKLANADAFIRMLPNGYQTVIEGDGSSLSQGQCQLLSIARVTVSDPPVLILDEATSSIDTRTEALVTQGMDKLMEGRTVFAIAHRLSTIQNANVIIVLKEGKVIERGTHEQLLAEKGLYWQLFTGATELE